MPDHANIVRNTHKMLRHYPSGLKGESAEAEFVSTGALMAATPYNIYSRE